jgi:RNA polymerase sigma-70 factor, ECF subfamily
MLTMPIDVEALYSSYGPMALRRCRQLLRDEAAAMDAMHDVFVELLRRRHTLHDLGPANLLMTVATNVCLNRIRSRGRRPETAQPELLLEIAALDPVEDRTLARRALDRLFRRHPRTTCVIATLRYIDDLTLDEVALEVGMSLSGVRKRLRSLQHDRPTRPFARRRLVRPMPSATLAP